MIWSEQDDLYLTMFGGVSVISTHNYTQVVWSVTSVIINDEAYPPSGDSVKLGGVRAADRAPG